MLVMKKVQMMLVLARVWLTTTNPSWWLALKYHPGVSKHAYDYADSIRPSLVSRSPAHQSILTQLVQVLAHYYFAKECNICEIGLIEWNGRAPRRRKRYTGPQPAHAKGFLVVYVDGAVLLTHSAPKLPTRDAELNHFYPDDALSKAHHFFYANLTSTAVELFAEKVLLYLWPKVQTARMIDPEGILGRKYPSIKNIILNHGRGVAWKKRVGISQVTLPLSDGTDLVVITKPAGNAVSIYEHAGAIWGPILAQTSLRGAAKEPSSPNVRRVCVIRTESGFPWYTIHDRSKYFVSKDAGTHFVGTGDLDRRGPLWYRGGSLFMLRNQQLSDSLRARFIAYDRTCAESNHGCTFPLVRDARKNDYVCNLSANKKCRCKDVECCKQPSISNSTLVTFQPTMGGCVGLKCALAGVWSNWTAGSCSKPCGDAFITRARTCMPQDGSGALCSGPSKFILRCDSGDCANLARARTGCCGCPPSVDNTFFCMNGMQCAARHCCDPHGGVERCPANLPFLCKRSSCVATALGCAFDGGVQRFCPMCQDNDAGLSSDPSWGSYNCKTAQAKSFCTRYTQLMATYCPKTCGDCHCFDDNGGLQAKPGWGGYTCASTPSFYCGTYPRLMVQYCALTCHLCHCQDDDFGLQFEPGWSRYYCADSVVYCQSYPEVRKHCRNSCHACHCQDYDAGLQAVWGPDYKCAGASRYCIPDAKILLRFCPVTCHVCDCADDDGGLQLVFSWKHYFCTSSTRYCSSHANVMHVYCRKSCKVCDSTPHRHAREDLRKKMSPVAEKCPTESNCAVSSSNAPCTAVIGEVRWVAWNEVHSAWVKDHCVLHAYEQGDFHGTYQKFYSGTHAFEPRTVRSAKCDCAVCTQALLPKNIVVSSSQMARNGFNVTLECAHGYVLVGVQPRATVCDVDGTPYNIEHAEGCAPSDD